MKTKSSFELFTLATVAFGVMGLYGDVVAQGAFRTATNHVASGSETASTRSALLKTAAR